MDVSLPEMGDWDAVFDETYLRTYVPFLDEERTRREALGAAALAGIEPGADVLDCPAGFGRHALVRRVLRPGGALVVETMHRDLLGTIYVTRGWDRLPDGSLFLQEREPDWVAGTVSTLHLLVTPDGERRAAVRVPRVLRDRVGRDAARGGLRRDRELLGLGGPGAGVATAAAHPVRAPRSVK